VRAASAAPDLAGREIGGRYRILAKLGEGGMGAVYRGEQISLKRKVAIKLLHPELSADPWLVRRFNAEAQLAAKLSHPNTVNVYDFGQDSDGTLFIAMELLEGRSLRQLVNGEGPLPVGRALHIAAQVAASIADAHHHGIVHRDLKPDNVMVCERGRDKDIVRVLDFGIAKLRDEHKKTVNPMTLAGDLVGTPQYMAPEQIRGESVDGRCDVYALGAIVYETVTGRLVFEGPSVMVILSRHLLDPVEPPSRRRPDLGLPSALDELVVSMLAKAPADRPASMEIAGERIAQVAATVGGFPTRLGSSPGGTGAQTALPTGLRAMRPPGVPQTLGATGPMTAPPPAPPPPAPAQRPVLPAAQIAPPRPASLTWVWVVLAVLGLAGAIGTIVALTRSRPTSAGATPQPPPSDDTPSPAPLDDHRTTPTTPTARGDEVEIGNYHIVLPLGFIEAPGATDDLSTGDLPAATDAHAYTGSLDGNVIGIIAFATSEDLSTSSRDVLDDGCRDLARSFFGGDKNGSRMIRHAGLQRYRCTIAGSSQAAEAVLYAGSGGSLVVLFAAEPSAFDALRAARTDLFDHVRGP